MDKLAQQYIYRHPVDASRTFIRYDDPDKAALLADMPAVGVAALLENMSTTDATHCLTLLPIETVMDILAAMPSNLAAACVRRVPGTIRTDLLELAKLKPELKRMLQLLRYSVHDAGAIMDPDLLIPRTEATIAEVIELVQRYPAKLKDIIFAVDESQILAGYLFSRELLLAGPGSRLRALLRPCRYVIAAHAHLQAAADSPGWQESDYLPVVDSQNVLLGVLPRDELDRRLAELGKNNPFNEQPGDILIGLAETFVNTCSEILFPDKSKS